MTKEGLTELQDTYQSLMGLDEQEFHQLEALSRHDKRAGQIYETGIKYFEVFEKRLIKLKSVLKHLHQTGAEQSQFLDPRAINGIKLDIRKKIIFLLHELAYDAQLIHHVIESFTEMDDIHEDMLDTSSKVIVKILLAKRRGIETLQQELNGLRRKLQDEKAEFVRQGDKGDFVRATKRLEKILAVEDDIKSKEQHEENMLRDVLAISEKTKKELKDLLGNIDYVRTILSNAVAVLNDFARVADPQDGESVETFYKQTDALFDTLRNDVDIAIQSVKKVHDVLKKMHKHDHLVFALQVKLARENDEELADLKKAIKLTRQINVAKYGLTGL